MSKLINCDCFWSSLGDLGFFVVVFALFVKIIVQTFVAQHKMNLWKRTPKDTIILHGFPPEKSLLNLSPFVLKIETFLRLANLNYTWDRNDFFEPKGKSLWISLNGLHVGDSELIINFISSKFEKNFSLNSSPVQLAFARVTRAMLEETFTCAIGMEQMIYGDLKTFQKIVDIPRLFFYHIRFLLTSRYKQQGIALHTKEEVISIMTKNLKAASVILRKKKFFGGDNICEDDCGIFGVLAQCLWGLPEGSPYEKLMNGECSNLKDYCIRIRKNLWADWKPNKPSSPKSVWCRAPGRITSPVTPIPANLISPVSSPDPPMAY